LGIESYEQGGNRALFFTREITDVQNYINDKDVKNFIDMKGKGVLDDEARLRIEAVTGSGGLLESLLPENNVQRSFTSWNVVTGNDSVGRSKYLDDLSKLLQVRISDEIEIAHSLISSTKSNDHTFNEVHFHSKLCESYTSSFVGRESERATIFKHILQLNNSDCTREALVQYSSCTIITV
jgi:hypothetical protein